MRSTVCRALFTNFLWDWCILFLGFCMCNLFYWFLSLWVIFFLLWRASLFSWDWFHIVFLLSSFSMGKLVLVKHATFLLQYSCYLGYYIYSISKLFGISFVRLRPPSRFHISTTTLPSRVEKNIYWIWTKFDSTRTKLFSIPEHSHTFNYCHHLQP